MISRKLQITILLLVLAAIGMGFYAVYLKRQAAELRGPQPVHEIAPPASGPPARLCSGSLPTKTAASGRRRCRSLCPQNRPCALSRRCTPCW